MDITQFLTEKAGLYKQNKMFDLVSICQNALKEFELCNFDSEAMIKLTEYNLNHDSPSTWSSLILEILTFLRR